MSEAKREQPSLADRVVLEKQDISHSLLCFDVIARCAILGQALTTICLAWFVSASLTSKLIEAGGAYGQLTLIIFSVCVAIGVLDVIINDFLPPQALLISLRRYRHSVFHWIAGLYFLQAFVSVGNSLGVEDFLALNYLLVGMVSVWYSWAISVQGTHV